MKTTSLLFPLFFIPFLLSAQWSSLTMLNSRAHIIASSANGKIYTAGGTGLSGYLPNIISYDTNTETWDQSIFLDVARTNVSTVIHGDKLFCAGGIIWETSNEFLQVEIIDLVNQEVIDVDSLSVPRVLLSSVAVGDKVLFAGGFDVTFTGISPTELTAFSTVDIYDIPTDTWSTLELSESRGGMAHTVLDDKAYFAGGYKGNGEVSSRVDIYDASTDTWSTAELSEARAFYGGGVAANGKVYFAGGLKANSVSSNQIDIYDPVTNTWSVDQISIPRMGVVASATDGFILFAGGGDGDLEQFIYTNASNIVDIYNIATGEWDVHFMNHSRVNHAIASSGNQVFIMGGYNFSIILSAVEVFTEEITGIRHLDDISTAITVYPNPAKDIIHINNTIQEQTQIKLLDLYGKVLLEVISDNQNLKLDLSPFQSGVYFLKGISEKNGHHFSKKIIHNKD